MSQTFDAPSINSPILGDVALQNAINQALAKMDVNGFADLPNDSKRVVFNDVSGEMHFEILKNGAWTKIAKIDISAKQLGGYLPSMLAQANTVVVRNAENKMVGDLEGNADSATVAMGLDGVLPVANGGTGGNDAPSARQNLGAASSADLSSLSTSIAQDISSLEIAVSTAQSTANTANTTADTALNTANSAATVANGKWTAVNGSTSVRGILQLSNSTTSTSTALAATANAVKTAYDRGSSALTVANGKWTAQTASTTVAGILEIATDAEASAGTATNKIITPKQLNTYGGGGVATVDAVWKATNGGSWYRKWSDGFIEQGGVYALASGTATKTITFPIAFTTTVYVTLTVINGTSNGYGSPNNASLTQTWSRTTTTMKVADVQVSGTLTQRAWYAAGY